MNKVRIGIIGAGGNTRSRHIPGFQAIEGVEVVCVANRSEESGRKVADQFGIPRVHSHWRQVIADPQVDAVLIGTWPYLHARATCESLEAGKPVLTEARMASSVAEALRMLKSAQETGLPAMIVPSPFGLKGDRFMRRLIAEGYLGQVREVYVRFLTSAQAYVGQPLSWRQREDLSGVNILALGIINETVQRWYGAAESVIAQTALFVPRRTDPETGQLQDVDIPDSITVVARQLTGANCVYLFSAQAHFGGAGRIEAYGSEGTLIYDLSADAVTGARAGEEELKALEIPAGEAGGWRVEEDFIAAVRGEAPVALTSFRDGVKYMRFTEAARRSAATGRRVHLAEL